ncbi:calsequestrin-1-like [Cynara cardunculus var. scolymus]|uniref:calsequestrin-1-like n=1 Tax=Cynara cardunculus var. scolymus TaxID=59895 RepID=UPI000D6296E3|nr:calsequestrin-1-like [Cynara cardunculus var. scolymus]
MAAKNVNFTVEDISFKANNHIALLDIPTNKTIKKDAAAFQRMSSIAYALNHEPVMVREAFSMPDLPDNETLTTGPEVAPLEAPQHTGAHPHERTMEPTSVNPSDNDEGPSARDDDLSITSASVASDVEEEVEDDDDDDDDEECDSPNLPDSGSDLDDDDDDDDDEDNFTI